MEVFLRWRGSGGVNVCDDEGQHLSELTHGQDSGGEAGALKALRLETAQPNERNPGNRWTERDDHVMGVDVSAMHRE